MPRRLIRALSALVLTMSFVIPAAAAPAGIAPGWLTPGGHSRLQEETYVDETYVEPAAAEAPAVEEPYVEQTLVEDEFAAFSMPGMSPDNLTTSVLADIDAFWATELGAGGFNYYAAGIVPVSEVVFSSCGQFGPYDNPAAFCPLDDTVYHSIPLAQEIQTTIGDFAWITVLAHEWGHHVQLLLGITPELSIDRELQADCFAGAYALRALNQGFLQEGDVTEAMVITILSADPIEMAETVDGAHGSSDYRVTAFMEGYFGGSSACMD
jgi:predicted metalloprotease